MLAERLMLLIYAYGTNCGIRSVTSGAHPHTEEELRYVRRRCLSAEVARMVAVEIANATFAVRDAGLWGAGLWGAGSLARRAWVGGGALPAPPKPHDGPGPIERLDAAYAAAAEQEHVD